MKSKKHNIRNKNKKYKAEKFAILETEPVKSLPCTELTETVEGYAYVLNRFEILERQVRELEHQVCRCENSIQRFAVDGLIKHKQ